MPPLSASAWVGGRTLADPRWLPGGERVSFITRNGPDAQLAVLPANGTGPEEWLALEPAIKGVGASGSGTHDWLPGGRSLVYVGVDSRVHRFDLDTNRSRALTPAQDGISGLSLAPDGTAVAYVVDMKQVAVVSTEPGESWPRLVSRAADFAVDPSWSPDGAWLTWTEWDNPNMAWDGARIVARHANPAEPRLLVAGGNDVSVQQPRFSPDGTKLTYLSDETGWLNLWVVDVPDFANARPLVEETYEHGAPVWGPGQRSYTWIDSNTVAFSRNEGGVWRTLRAEVGTGIVHPLAPHATGAMHGANDKVLGLSSGPRTPTQIVVHDISAGRTHALARAQVAGIEANAVDPEHVSWTASDGAEIHGRLYRTPGHSDGASPLLVSIHGGPTDQSAATLHARYGYFLDRGWSVLVPDHRGSTGWGRQYTQAMRGRWGDLDVSDTAAGVRAAIDRGWGDPAHIVAVGGSAGGLTTLSLLADHPDLFAGGVAQYPVCDLFDIAWSTHRLEAHYLDSVVGPLPDAHDEYVRRSPLAKAESIRAPLLLLHGSEDPVVPVAQSAALAARIDRSVTVERHVYEGEGHGWRKPATRADELARMDTFLRRNVLHVGPANDDPGLKEKS